MAARGLDIPNVTNVINFDLPTNIDGKCTSHIHHTYSLCTITYTLIVYLAFLLCTRSTLLISNIYTYLCIHVYVDYVHRIGRTGRVGNVGNALAFFNEKNRNIGKELAELLIENDQVCPEWLERYYTAGAQGFGGGRGGGGRGRGGGRGPAKFGAKDYRREGAPGPGRGAPMGGRGPMGGAVPAGYTMIGPPQTGPMGGGMGGAPPRSYAPAPAQGGGDNSAW